VQDEFGEFRGAARVEDGEGVLVVADGQQGREVAQVLLEEVVRRGDPPFAEPGARPDALGLEFGRAGVGGLLEQRRPGLAPQLAAEQEGRVGAHGDLRGGDGLRGVPHGGEAARRDLEVQLDGGAGGFRRDGPGGAAQMLHARYVEHEVLAAGGHDLVVEEGVAVDVGEVRGDQVVAVERRQNTDHHDARIDLARFPVGICQRGAQFLGEPVEYPPGQAMWGYVDFQIEHGEFCLEISACDPLQYLRIQHFRHAVRTGEIQFDLQPHEVLRAIEPLLRQKPLQARQALPELAAVPLPIGQVEPACHDLLPHRSVPPRMGGPIRSGRRCPGSGGMMPSRSDR
jgi:hypothetical protein